MKLTKEARRERIKHRIRKVVNGTVERPRMSVFRSNRAISVQLIDDINGHTLAAASSIEKAVLAQISGMAKKEVATVVGKLAAERAIEKGINTVVFDRNGYNYHGRVKCLAEAAREGGLKF